MKLFEMHRREFMRRTGGAVAGSQLGALKVLGGAAGGVMGGKVDLGAAIAAYKSSGLDAETMLGAAGIPHTIPGFYGKYSKDELGDELEQNPQMAQYDIGLDDDGDHVIVIPQNIIIGYLANMATEHPDEFIYTLVGADGETRNGFNRSSGDVYSMLMQQLAGKLGVGPLLANLMQQCHYWHDVQYAVDNAMRMVPQLAQLLAKAGITPDNWTNIANSPQVFHRLDQLGIKVPGNLRQNLVDVNKRVAQDKQQRLDYDRDRQNQRNVQRRRQSSRPVRADLSGGMHQDWDEFMESLRRQFRGRKVLI